MTAAADLVLTNTEAHAPGLPDETHGAIAVHDGEVIRIGRAFDVGLLADVETWVVDCGGRVVLPGFIGAHTHLPMVNRLLVHADLLTADSSAKMVELLRERVARVKPDNGTDGEVGWVLGYGYDKSTWDDSRYLTHGDFDVVSESRFVVTFRGDVHAAGVNSVVLDESPWKVGSIRGVAASIIIMDDRIVFGHD